MPYDFDTRIDRRGTGAVKWSGPADLGGGVIPLWVADMDFAPPPAVVAAIQRRAAHPVYGYAYRTEEYQEALVSWMRRRHGWQVDRSWICPSPGVVPALAISVLAFTRPGDKVLIQPPVYRPFSTSIAENGRRIAETPLVLRDGRYAMDLEGLERAIDGRTRMLILCSPHNPVGRVWEAGELEALVGICERRGVVIVSDEIHSDIVMPGRRHRPLASLSEAAARIVVTLTAPNKTFNIAGIATASALIPDPRLRAAFAAQTASLGLDMTNLFGIVAQTAAYEEGEAWLEELLVYLEGNYGRLLHFAAERLPGLRVFPLEGSYLAWIDCSGLGMDDDRLRAFFLEEAGVWLDEGTKFGTGGSGFMRLNLACPRSLLDEALGRMEAALRRAGFGRN